MTRFRFRLRDFRTRTKISMIFLLLLAPIGYAIWTIAADKQALIAESEREQKGSTYIALTRPAVFAIGDGTKREAVGAAVEAARQAQKQLRESKELGILADEFAFTAEMSAANGGDADAAMEKAAALLARAAEESNLSVDPELESYYLGNVLDARLPAILGQLVAERDTAAAVVAADELSTEQRVRFLTLSGMLKVNIDGLRADFAGAFRARNSLSAPLSGPLNAFVKSTDSFALALDQGLTDRNGQGADAGRITQNYAAVIAAAGDLWTVTTAQLDRLVAERVARLKSALNITLAIVSALVLSSLTVAAIMLRQIVGPLGRLERLANDVRASDDYSLRIDYDSRDEVGRLAAAFNGMLSEVAEGRARAVKRAEEREQQRELQQKLVEQERRATLDQLTATVSHELRNPLSAIRNSLYVIEQTPRTRNLSIERALDRINRSIQRCENIISQLVEYSQIRALQRRGVTLDKWLAELLDDQSLPGDIEIVRDFGAPGQTVSCDADHLRRAVLNLIENAVQAIQRARGDDAQSAKVGNVVPDGRSDQIWVRSRSKVGRIEIQIADSGPGIARDVLPRIFEPLFSTKAFGIGLGLPLVKQILDYHGGGVEVTSDAGHGACATLWMPLAEESEVAA
jgi:signal transduction histidine kinase